MRVNCFHLLGPPGSSFTIYVGLPSLFPAETVSDMESVNLYPEWDGHGLATSSVLMKT